MPRLSELVDASRLILTCGISGSGKTTLSRRLGSRGFRRLSADALIHDAFGAELSALPFEERRLRFAAVAQRLLEMAVDALRRGERVVVDSTLCKRKMRNAYRRHCSEIGVAPLIIYLPADFEILISRLATRKGESPDDQVVSREELQYYFDNFEAPQADEAFISVSASMCMREL